MRMIEYMAHLSSPWVRYDRLISTRNIALAETLPFQAETLLLTYTQGIFPMAEGRRIAWYQPDPRAILPLDSFTPSKTLMQTWRQKKFDVRINTSFEEVMRGCADREDGSWISEKFIKVYGELHQQGFAHSVEAWHDNKLAGGLYGVALGGAFFGESMFHRSRDASKIALVALVERMKDRGFSLLDIQFISPHLEKFGAIEIPHVEFANQLNAALHRKCQLS
jgi:leucyl/phenylalanyl-tRNA--protein transferase